MTSYQIYFKSKPSQFFDIETTRRSAQGSNISLALSVGELWPNMSELQLFLTRVLKGLAGYFVSIIEILCMLQDST